MKEALKSMISLLFGGSINGLDLLSKDLNTYSTQAHDFVQTVSDKVVFPIAIAVLSIVMMIELNRKAVHIEGDHQTGAKLIFGVIFKYILLATAVKNASMLLEGIRTVINSIAGSDTLKGVALDPPSTTITKFNEAVDKAGTIDQVGMLLFLLIPFLIGLVAKASVSIIIFMRFAELYALTAFAPLPFAFLANDETKPMGTNYLKKYVEVCLHGSCIIIAALLYSKITTDPNGNSPFSLGELKDQGALTWLLNNYLPILAAPVLLMMMIFGAGKIAKALSGNG